MAMAMMSGGGDMTDIRQVMFSNLQILGLDNHAMEKIWRIPFNKEMFDLPNKKGFEAVMYFLFDRLNPAKCKEEFRYCWKVQDKKDEHQFRKICFNWLTDISEHDEDAQLPRFVASIFMSPGGHRFIHLLLHFSRYVLQTCIKSETNLRGLLQLPSVTARTVGVAAEVTEASLRCAAIRHRQRFLQHGQSTVQTQDTWAAYAGELVRRYRGLHRTVRELEHDLRTEAQRAVEKGKARGCSVAHKKRRSGGLEYDFDVEAVKRAQKVRKVRELWQRLSLFRTGLAADRDIVSSVLDGHEEKYRIDGAELNVKVPERLLRQQHKELLRRNVENVYRGGKLNLQSLIQLCNLSLHLYIQKFDSCGVPNFTDMEGPVTTQVHTHNAHLSNAEALRMRIEGEMIPHLKQSIEQLKRKLDQKMLRCRSPESIRLTSVGLGLLPPTPPMSFDPRDGMNTSMDERIKRDLARPHGDTATTPEAASQLMAAIDGKVRRQILTQGSPANIPLPRQRTQIPTKQSSIARADTAVTDRVGSKHRTRMRSAPSRATTDHIPAPTFNTRLQDIDDSTLKSSLGATSIVKQTLTAQATHHKSKAAEQAEKGRPPRRGKSTKTTRSDAPPPPAAHVEKHQNIIASFVSPNISPRGPAQGLADQIAEAVMSGQDDVVQQLTDQLHNPATLLGEEAFMTRSRLQFSPETKTKPPTPSSFSTSSTPTSHHHQQQQCPSHTWHQLREQDSVGPLSSTQLSSGGGASSSNSSGHSRKGASSSNSSGHSRRGASSSNSSGYAAGGGGSRRRDHPVESQLFSPEDPENEVITIAARPHTPAAATTTTSAKAKSPKADLYHRVKAESPKTAVQHSPTSLHSGWSSPNHDFLQVTRSPHGSRSHLRSQSSTTCSSPLAGDPHTRDLFEGMDGEIEHEQDLKHDVEGRDALDSSSLDRSSNAKNMSYSSRDVLDNEYLTLIATQTPQLPVRSRPSLREQNRNNNSDMECDSEQGDEGREQQPQAFSLLTMTPAAGRKFAEQSARIVAYTGPDDLSVSRSTSRSTPDEEELLRRSLTVESEVDEGAPVGRREDDISGQNSSDESLNRQTQKLLDLGLARQGRLQDNDDDDDELISLGEDTTDKNSNNSATSSVDDLIQRYRKLREVTSSDNNNTLADKTTNENDNGVHALKERYRKIQSGFSAPSSRSASPAQEPVVESRFLERTPVKEKPHARFALDLDDDDEEEAKSNSPALVTREWLASGKENRLLGGGLLDEDFSDVMQLSPFQTPTQTPKGTPKGTPSKLDSPRTLGLKFSSLPMSPLTDALHRHSPSGHRKTDHWADILGEDASVLLPASPADN